MGVVTAQLHRAEHGSDVLTVVTHAEETVTGNTNANSLYFSVWPKLEADTTRIWWRW